MWSREDLVDQSTAIASQISGYRLYTKNGSLGWLGPAGYGTDLIPLRVVQLGPYLYDGVIGISLFFAALSRVGGATEFRDLALEAIAPLRQKISELTADTLRSSRLRIPLGGLIGIGSLIYGLVKIAEMLDEPALVEEANKATLLITSERIANDVHGRIQTGCAGAILALLALHKKLPEPNEVGRVPLDIACDCAHHLVEALISVGGGPRAWPLSPGKPPLAGFSYGAAGICYSLMRLYDASREEEFRKAAETGLFFIDSLYVSERKSWRDARVPFQSQFRPLRGTWKDWWASGSLEDLERLDVERRLEDHFPETWCHGSAGIVMARLGLLHLEDSPKIRFQIEGVLDRQLALALDDNSDLEGPDDLCCGHMGMVDSLLFASCLFKDELLRKGAHELMSRVQRRAQLTGGYELSAARGSTFFAPSLFQGIAGIGYTLLRLAAPDRIPCLLLFK